MAQKVDVYMAKKKKHNDEPVVTEKRVVFNELVLRAAQCQKCPRMEGRSRVLGQGNGNLNAKIMFIAEAPGRKGADISGVPLCGDQTGRNFDALMEHSGLRREDVFITNAVLCNPRDEQDRNSTPTKQEIAECSIYLRAILEIVQPKIVVTLGRVALDALRDIEAHTVMLAQDTGQRIAWKGRWLVPLYHPGPRARLHRSLSDQKNDFVRLAGIVND